jgi:hypothetical protein
MQNMPDDSKTPGRPVSAGGTIAVTEHEPGPSSSSGRADSPVDFTEARGKHLDMLLGVVCQMSGAGAATRRYCLCLAALALGVSYFTGQPVFLALMVGLALIFWTLDAGYSQRRRLFEQLYEEVRSEPRHQRPDFRVAVAAGRQDVRSRVRTFWGGSRVVVYPTVIALLIFAGFRL